MFRLQFFNWLPAEFIRCLPLASEALVYWCHSPVKGR
jgi:hypothetical protein